MSDVQHFEELHPLDSLLDTFLRQQIDEYKAETERLRHCLNHLGMSQKFNTTQDGPLENLIEILSEVSLDLCVDDPSEAALSLALSDLRLKVAKHPLENLREIRRQENNRAEKLEQIESLSKSESVLAKLESQDEALLAEINQKKTKMVFMVEKQKEYQKLCEKYDLALKSSGYRPEITHDAIEKIKSQLDQARQNELKPLKAKLQSYHGLPPNKDLAIARIAEAEHELESLTQDLTKHISALHV